MRIISDPLLSLLMIEVVLVVAREPLVDQLWFDYSVSPVEHQTFDHVPSSAHLGDVFDHFGGFGKVLLLDKVLQL